MEAYYRYCLLIEQAERLNFRLYDAMRTAQVAGHFSRAARCRHLWHMAANRTARRMMKRGAVGRSAEVR